MNERKKVIYKKKGSERMKDKKETRIEMKQKQSEQKKGRKGVIKRERE